MAVPFSLIELAFWLPIGRRAIRTPYCVVMGAAATALPVLIVVIVPTTLILFYSFDTLTTEKLKNFIKFILSVSNE